MGKFRTCLISLSLFSFTLIAPPVQATSPSQIITCTNQATGKIVVLASPQTNCRSFQAKAIWQGLIGKPTSGTLQINLCTSKRAQFNYQIIKASCAKYQNTNQYWRAVKVPARPIIKSISALGANSIMITVALDGNDSSLSSPIIFYTVLNLVTNKSEQVKADSRGLISINGLSPSTSYKFKITAVNIDGSSESSEATPEVLTNAAPKAPTSQTSQTSPALYSVGDRGPGGGIIFYVASRPFTSAGSTCNTNCRYLEVAPSTWQNGISEEDSWYTWSTNWTLTTGQDLTTPSTEGRVVDRTTEKANWRIGAGFYNTSVMKVAGAQSDAQAAVLRYAGNDSSAGQWFLPSLNELNELCKFARGQRTGDPSVACSDQGYINDSALFNSEAIGFGDAIYWSSSERDAGRAWLLNFNGRDVSARGSYKYYDIQIRPIRAF
jgi:hypothetical protein